MREPRNYVFNDGRHCVAWYEDGKLARRTFTEANDAEVFYQEKLLGAVDKTDLVLKEVTSIRKYITYGKIAEIEAENVRLRDELEALRQRRPELGGSEKFQSAVASSENFKSAVHVVRPEFEKAVGHRPAIALQQLSWLLAQEKFGVELGDGRRYIYNTYAQWKSAYFENWSIPTIKRVFTSLEKGGWVDSKQPEGRRSRRKYYTLSPEGINLIRSAQSDNSNCALPSDQVDPSLASKRSVPTSTKNENTSKQLLAPDGEQDLLGRIEECLGSTEMKNNGGMWRKRIRGGPRERRGLRNTIEDFKNRIRDPARVKIHHPAKWFTDKYLRNLIEIEEAERAKNESNERSAAAGAV
jgi:DNA-binding PadR family transcriptional regulator